MRKNSKIIFGKSHYEGGRKYCRRCEIYLFHDGTFCPRCGMALRVTSTARKDKEKLKENQRLRALFQSCVKP
jgi:uncharacterized Zn finger protein (UPF0148 family)